MARRVHKPSATPKRPRLRGNFHSLRSGHCWFGGEARGDQSDSEARQALPSIRDRPADPPAYAEVPSDPGRNGLTQMLRQESVDGVRAMSTRLLLDRLC